MVANDGPDHGGFRGVKAGAAGGCFGPWEDQSQRRLGKIGNHFCSLSYIASNEGLSVADRKTLERCGRIRPDPRSRNQQLGLDIEALAPHRDDPDMAPLQRDRLD